MFGHSAPQPPQMGRGITEYTEGDYRIYGGRLQNIRREITEYTEGDYRIWGRGITEYTIVKIMHNNA